jgi:hypothetical protein
MCRPGRVASHPRRVVLPAAVGLDWADRLAPDMGRAAGWSPLADLDRAAGVRRSADPDRAAGVRRPADPDRAAGVLRPPRPDGAADVGRLMDDGGRRGTQRLTIAWPSPAAAATGQAMRSAAARAPRPA